MTSSPQRIDQLILKADSISVAKGGRSILKGLDLSLWQQGARGTITALLGPSGIGKTTLLRILAGVDRPDQGSVQTHGCQVGMLAQNYPLFRHRTALSNVLVAARNARIGKEKEAQFSQDLLISLDIADASNRFPSQLSGGQRQRVALAQQLACKPGILLLDEPTSGLDVVSVAKVTDIIRNVACERGIPMLVATHDLMFALDVADRIVLLGWSGEGASIVGEYYIPPRHCTDALTHLETTIRAHFRKLQQNGDTMAGMAVQDQVHDKFMVFVGSSVDELNAQVEEFTGGGAYAAKSIGVEYLEAKGKLVLSLGYREGSGYSSKLLSKAVGTIDVNDSASLASLANALTEVAKSSGEVICHELYVTSSGEVTAVFLAQG